MRLHSFFGSLLQVLKWPIALGAAWGLPPVLWALWCEAMNSFSSFSAVLGGAVCYVVIWRLALRKWSWTALSTLEHELTHSLFAALTGNRITGLRVSLKSGGHMRYEGTPNWLVEVAPYFFPLATACMMLALPFIPALKGLTGQIALGMALGYNLTAGWSQLHPDQTDLQKAGFVFCGLFLPMANACTWGLTLATARAGWAGMGEWLFNAVHAPWQWSVLVSAQ